VQDEPSPRDGNALPLADDIAAMFPKSAIERLFELLDEEKEANAKKRKRHVTKRVKRFEAALQSLDAFVDEMRADREDRQKLEARVLDLERQGAKYRTGSRGRPGSKHLVLGELERRAKAGDLEKTLAEQARVLKGWLVATHRDAHPMTEGSIEEAIRTQYRAWQKRAKRNK
jgi:hypothetical protein